MVFHMSLSDSKSPQASWTHLSILAYLNNAVVWMVSVCPLISKSSSPLTKHSGTFPSIPIKIGITVIFIFHSYFSHLGRSKYSSRFSLFLIFTLWSSWTAKSSIRQVLLFCWLSLVRPRLGDQFVSQNPREVCACHSGLGIYHLFVWSNLNCLHNSQWITLPTQLCLVFHSFCTNLLHIIIII